MKKILSALIAAVACAGAASAQPVMPPLQFEGGPPPIMPMQPGHWILEPGHWQWNGYNYVWVGRHWILQCAGWGHYVPGHWVVTLSGTRWVSAHWVP
jgi:hypothetical protein